MNPRVNDETIDLGGAWLFGVTDRRLDVAPTSVDALRRAGLDLRAATVPGNLELDLLANGLIEEPFQGLNIVGLRKYERSYVYYIRSFAAPERPDTVPQLVFEGIDCFADIYLNGELIHHSDNMLIEQHIPVSTTLRSGAENIICAVLEPAIEHARRAEHAYPPGLTAEGSGYEGLYVRKAPHMYGWDIMPRALSAGLWRDVTLRYLPVERFETAWLETEAITEDGSEARLAFHFRTATAGDLNRYEVSISGTSGTSRFQHRAATLFDAGCVRFGCANPLLWWPRGRGEPNLYDVVAVLLKDGRPIDELRFSHGIRTVELDRTSTTTAAGDGQFCFRINGERIFVLGTNWGPADAYHSRDAARIPALVDLAEDLGCNAIRCWGGNVYENDLFYDLCDRKGILVWQDFAMACAIYPQDPTFQAQLRAEVTQVVRRLRQHACVALWAGDNECDEKYAFGSRRRDPNINVLTRDVIPAVLRDEDPSRPYLPSSPYVDEVAFETGRRDLPEDHLWGPRDYYKSPFYTTAVCHFASEIGYHGCPEPASIRRFLSPDAVWPYANNAEWLLHATSPIPGVNIHDYRVELMATQVRALFGTVPDGLDEFSAASQISQAEALKFFIESFRAAKWRRTGIIWWNLADGWPQFSDAIVDYYLAKKRAYHVVRRSQQPLCLVMREEREGVRDVVACNDDRGDVDLSFEVQDIDSGEIVAHGAARAEGDSVTRLASVPATAGSQVAYLMTWKTSNATGRNHYVAGSPPFSLPQFRIWMDHFGL